MKILVIRLSSLGDVICTTPLFTWLRKQHPGAGITFATGLEYAPLFSDDARIARVVGLSGSMDSQLDGTEWDLVVDLQNNGRSRSLLGRVKSAGRAGKFDKMHGARCALLCLRLNLYRGGQSVALRAIRAAGGIVADREIPPVCMHFRAGACAEMHGRFVRLTGGIVRPAIALFPFSVWKNKEWPAEGYVSVGRYFLTKGWDVALFGGPAEAGRAEKMAFAIGERCVSLAGKLSLSECGCLLSSFRLALGGDTGLSHLARACGVRTGVIFGPTVREFGFFPYGSPPFRVFEERIRCRPCHAHGGNFCLRMTRRCLTAVTEKRVITGLEELSQQ